MTMFFTRAMVNASSHYRYFHTSTAIAGVTTYVIAGISEPFDHLPCLNFKVHVLVFPLIQLQQYITPKTKMFRQYLTTYLNGIYEDRLLKCGRLGNHLTTVAHVGETRTILVEILCAFFCNNICFCFFF